MVNWVNWFRNITLLGVVVCLFCVYVLGMFGATIYVDLRYRDDCEAAGYDEVLLTFRFEVHCKKMETVLLTTTTPLDQIGGISE